MSTLFVADDLSHTQTEKPGAHLAAKRQAKGYSVEDVACKLHLRVKMIELLEADDYQALPESVFIKGYLRAYAKLLEIPADPLIENFSALYSGDSKIERTLWQSQRRTHSAEHLVRWVTGIFAFGVLVAVSFWWQNNKETARLFSANNLTHTSVAHNHLDSDNRQSETEIRLTDLSNMRSLLSSSGQKHDMEIQGG